MAYIDLTSLKADFDNTKLTEALDDNQDGAIDSDVWAAIQAKVAEEIDGILGQRYTTPFCQSGSDLPPIVKLAARTFAIEKIYDRRNLLNEKSPERIDAKNIRTKLIAIADGIEPLMPGVERARPSGSVIAEQSRVYSDRPAI